MAGQEAVPSVNGPLARTLTDIVLYTKTIIDSEPWLIDPKCVPIPWRVIELPKKLKIGVIRHDGIVTPTPPVQRALVTTVEHLRKAGHEIVEWAPEGHSKALSLLVGVPTCQLNTLILTITRRGCLLQMVTRSALSHGSWLIYTSKGGNSIQKALESSGEPWRPEMALYDNASELGVYEMWQIHRERTELAAMYLHRWNACEGLDVILGLRFHYLRF